MLVVDRIPGFLAKASVGSSVVKTKFMEAKESKLVYGEAKLPGDVSPVDGGADGFWGFSFSLGRGHGAVVKYRRKWACL